MRSNAYGNRRYESSVRFQRLLNVRQDLASVEVGAWIRRVVVVLIDMGISPYCECRCANGRIELCKCLLLTLRAVELVTIVWIPSPVGTVAMRVSTTRPLHSKSLPIPISLQDSCGVLWRFEELSRREASR